MTKLTKVCHTFELFPIYRFIDCLFFLYFYARTVSYTEIMFFATPDVIFRLFLSSTKICTVAVLLI